MNIFNKNEDKPLSQDPIDYLNKQDKPLFEFFASSWGKKENEETKSNIFKIVMIALPILAIALGTGLGVITNSFKDPISSIVHVNQDVIKRKIYLISEDDFTIPVTVSLDKKDNIYEEMLDVINLLKVSSNASSEHLRGYIPDQTKVNSFEIKNTSLFIDFSEEFLLYNEKNDHLLFNSLISSLTEFDEVDEVSIMVGGKYINDVLTSSYKVSCKPQCLNNIFSSPSLIENKKLITVFYEKEYEKENNYLVPISLYASVGESENITFVNALFKELPSYYNLDNIELYEDISKNQQFDNEFSLTVNKSALVDEQTVNKNLYELVKSSLDLMNEDDIVSFNIEGTDLKVDGIYEDEDQKVSEVYYNEIEI